MGAFNGFITSGAFARATTFCLLLAAGATGCQTVGGNAAKTRGVYTTLAAADNGFDMPGEMYSQKNSFGPGEDPSAVMLGYGDYNRQQSATLELVESGTSRVLFSREYAVSYGRASIQKLHIRLGGDYKVRLLVNGAEFDSFQFSVARTNQAGGVLAVNPNRGEAYAGEAVWLTMNSVGPPGKFPAYEEKLHSAVIHSISTEAYETNPALLVQRVPGKVDVKCRLAADGRISDAKIVANTIDGECGEIFLKGLLKKSPYTAWPDDLHRSVGADFREMTLTISLQ